MNHKCTFLKYSMADKQKYDAKIFKSTLCESNCTSIYIFILFTDIFLKESVISY